MDIWAKLLFTSVIVAIASILAIKATPDDAPDWVSGLEASVAVLGICGAFVCALIFIWLA